MNRFCLALTLVPNTSVASAGDEDEMLGLIIDEPAQLCVLSAIEAGAFGRPFFGVRLRLGTYPLLR